MTLRLQPCRSLFRVISAMAITIILFMLSGCGRVPTKPHPTAVPQRRAEQYGPELEWTWTKPLGGPSTHRGPAAGRWSHSSEEGSYGLTCCLLKCQEPCNIYAVILTVPQEDKEPLILSRLVDYQGEPLTVFDCHGQTVVMRPSRKSEGGDEEAGTDG